MMKNFTIIFVFLIAQSGFSQVGIGTVNPDPLYELDVNGSMLIQDNFKVNEYTNQGIDNTDYKFLVRKTNSEPVGEVAYIDMSTLTVGPVNIADYTFTNLKADNVTTVNLQFDADKYIVGLANFQYVGRHITKSPNTNIGHFRTRTFVDNGTWHIEIRNVSLDADRDDAITYHVTLIVYDRKYFKELPSIEYNMGGSASGEAPSPF